MEPTHIGWTTVETQEQGRRLARALLEQRLAACIHLEGPFTAFFTWQGKTGEATEYRLWVKFPARLEKQLAAFIGQHHPYDEPQWLCLPASSGLPGYLEWVDASCRK